MRNIFSLTLLGLLMTLVTPAPANPLGEQAAAQPADPLAGTFASQELTVVLKSSEEMEYTGFFRKGDAQYPLTAWSPEQGQLEGEFSTPDEEYYDFSAQLEGDTLSLQTGGKTYQLKRQGKAEKKTQTARAATDSSTKQVDRFSFKKVATSAAGGQRLIAKAPGAISAQALLRQTLDQLPQILKTEANITGAFGNEQDTQAGACFTFERDGDPMSGLVMAGLDGDDGQVEIAFDREHADGSSLAGLFSADTSHTPATASVDPSQWAQRPLPDGSGSMRLPEGWTITAASNGAVGTKGPGNQAVELGIAMPVNTPESEQAWLAQRMQLGLPAQPTGLPVLAYTGDPVSSLEGMMPILSQMGQNMGQPGVRLVKVIESVPTPFPQGQAAFIHISADQLPAGEAPVRMHALFLVAVSPVGNGQWMFYMSYAASPQQTFAADLPVMLGIWKSWKVSDATLRSRLDKAAQDMREIGQMIRDSHDYAQQVYDRANDDFIEYIRGRRTVQDTQTGEQHEVDLGNASDIVNGLNEQAGGNRFKEIPLRDQ